MTCVRQPRRFNTDAGECAKHERLNASLVNVRTVEEGTGLDICSFFGCALNSCPREEWQVYLASGVPTDGDITMYNNTTDESSIDFEEAAGQKTLCKEHAEQHKPTEFEVNG